MNKKIKILFTIPNFDTAGSGKVVYDLVNGLDKTLFAPEICCFHNKGEFFNIVEGLGVKIHLFDFATPYRPFHSYPFRIWSIYRFFKKNQFDIIHSWHWSSDISEPLAAKLAGIPFVYTKKAMGWGNKSWRWRSQLSTKIIAINKDMLTQFFKPFASKTVYMPLGIDTHYFQPLDRSRTLPNGMVFKESDVIIISIANLVPVKGLEVLLEAVELLKNDAVKVLIVGDYNSDYGLKLKKTYENEDRIFSGKQLDVRPYLAVADLFVIPTKDVGRKEGLPIAPLEAMASRRVVVGSSVSGIKDILDPFQLFLFEAGDAQALASVLSNITSLTETERLAIAKQMHERVCTSFSLKSCIGHHEALYRSIIKSA